MITKTDLEAAIAECQGERNPNANTCIKLAAFYTIRKEMFGEETEQTPLPAYSFAAEPIKSETEPVAYTSDTEFARLIDGKNTSDVLAVMDELMTTLQVLHPRLYDGVLRQLDA